MTIIFSNITTPHSSVKMTSPFSPFPQEFLTILFSQIANLYTLDLLFTWITQWICTIYTMQLLCFTNAQPLEQEALSSDTFIQRVHDTGNNGFYPQISAFPDRPKSV